MSTKDNITSLLDSSQRQRHHWSTMIITLMGFVIVLNAGLWSYFLPEYIKSAGAQPTLFLIPAAVSAITLGVWRIYTRYLDNEIASLYPELVFYELELSASEKFGTIGYLIRNVPQLEEIFTSEIPPDKKAEAIRILSKAKRIGNRKQAIIEGFTLGFIIVALIGSLYSILQVTALLASPYFPVYCVCVIVILIGLTLVIIALCCYQKNPSTKLVKDTLRELQQSQRTRVR